MEGEADLRAPHRNIVRPVQSNSSDVLSTSSNPDLIRDLQAVFKRHRPLGMMQSDKLKPKRSVVLQKEALRSSVLKSGTAVDTTKNANVALSSLDHTEKDLIVGSNNLASLTRVSQEHASITLPFTSGPDTKMNDESFNSLDVQRDQREPHAGNRDDNVVQLPSIEAHQASALDSVKKVQFSLGNHASLRGADDRMANEMGNLSSYMRSVALTEIEVDSRNQVEVSDISCDQKKQHLSNAESDLNLRSEDGIPSLLAKKTTTIQEDQLHHLGDFLSKPLTQSSVVGSSCTTTLVNSTSAPVFNSMTYGSTRLNQDCSSHMAFGNSQPIRREDMAKASYPASTYCSVVSAAQRNAAKTSASNINNRAEAKEYFPAKEPQGCVQKGGDILEEPLLDVKLNKGKELAGSGTNFQSEASSLRSINTDAKVKPSVSAKQSKVANDKGTNHSRKRNYDPDLFFKVNGKLYQRLGKIGSGGSSEVHKVISSDCTIYALKKIKLKGRDYATAYGFCQEIVYLNKLRGKNNIIQLIDSEVTDKTLLQEVMNGSMSNKDNRVKDDGYIYMVLEYGEIDLAHMLSQKWKEMDFSNQTIDENWLRFYWQQILQAVNTIHEERIVHSDLKPANFLLVKGSLKLIDFGIAKAIMSDTTNIQRDSQVGTLSYMSPEAFMCNENDVNGNTIKCGRSSDIWSLGCILYQMVYGRTPFSEYKTFWAKLKVITDPNHEITFEPVPNPCLLDLMKNCLAWDRNKRWRIPELLQHPFLVPPVPHPISSSRSFQSLELLKLIAGACDGNSEAFSLCCELEQILNNPASVVVSSSVTSRDQQCKLLARMYEVCFRLQQNLANRSV